MQRRVLLVALWLVFATAAVGVGFGAANLVGDPYADAQGGGGSVAITQQDTSAPQVEPGSTGSLASTSPSASPKKSGRKPSPTAAPRATRRSSSPTATSQQSPKPRSSTSAARPGGGGATGSTAGGGGGSTSQRSLSTRGGLVTAGCRDGLVSLGASPAVGWSIDEISQGRVEEAKVKFRRTGGGEGEIEVHATCVSGTPRFQLDDHESGDGGGRGDE